MNHMNMDARNGSHRPANSPGSHARVPKRLVHGLLRRLFDRY
jgi:hypothetical protein